MGDECINAVGTKTADGYVYRVINGKHVLAHKIIYQFVYGEIPVGLCIMHTCDNPACINPKHLRAGTWADNNKDRASKGRSYLPRLCVRGHVLEVAPAYLQAKGQKRYCPLCQNIRGKKWRDSKREAEPWQKL